MCDVGKLCAMLVLWAGAVWAGPTHYVAASGGNTPPYLSWADAAHEIQDALDAAVDGDVVVVTDGTYKVVARAPIVLLNKGVTLTSVNGPAHTIIDGEDYYTGVHFSHAAAVCDGFTITHCASQDPITSWYAICFLSGGGTLRNCQVVNNRVEFTPLGAAAIIMVTGGSKGIVEDCLIADNYPYYLVGVSSISELLMDRCIIRNNNSIAGLFYAYNKLALRNCLIASNIADFVMNATWNGIVLDNCTIAHNSLSTNALWLAGDVDMRNTIVYGNTAGNVGGGSSNALNCCTQPLMALGINGISNAPQFVNPALSDYRLPGVSPCVNRGTNFMGIVLHYARTLLFDFGLAGYETTGNWNNVTNYTVGLQLAGAVATNGSTTGVALEITKAFVTNAGDGVLTPGRYPLSAQRDSVVIGTNSFYGAYQAEVVLTGLGPTKRYTLRFFASANDGGIHNAEFFANGIRSDAILHAEDNLSNGVAIAAVAPDASGCITVQCVQTSGDPGRLGVMELVEFTTTWVMVPALWHDLAGTNRVMQEIVDMGCYEYPGTLAPWVSIGAATTAPRQGDAVNLAALCSAPAAAITNVVWDFGDGSPPVSGGMLTNVAHAFVTQGLCTVAVTVADTNGLAGSAVLDIVVSPPVPNAPTNLAATTVSPAQIALNWTDQATNETGFVIQRKVAPLDVIVDNADPVARVSYYGTVSVQTNWPGYYGSNYAYLASSARAFVKPGLTQTGLYEIFMWNPSSRELSPQIYTEVGTTTGRVVLYTDEYGNARRWQSLGVYPLNNTCTVLVFNVNFFHNGDTVFDALRFVKEDPWLTIGTAGIGSTNFSDMIATVNTAYAYRVAAVNAEGTSAWCYANAEPWLPPTAVLMASPTSGVYDLAVTFTGWATNGSAAVTNYTLNFGDGAPVASIAPQTPLVHTYLTDGVFTATLTVADTQGFSGSATRTIHVLPEPVAVGCLAIVALGRLAGRQTMAYATK